MQWYELNPKRLEVEIYLMQANGVNFELYEDENSNLLWRGPLHVLGHIHRDVRIVYPANFPYEPINLYILGPKLPPSEHVWHDGKICYCKFEEWDTGWTAFAVYLTAIRFLYEYYSGKIERSDFHILPYDRNVWRIIHRSDNGNFTKGLFKRILRVLRE